MNGADIKQQEEQKMSKTLFISADEVARELQISKRQAYRIIRDMNAELEKGYADMQAGHTRSAKSVFADIRKDYNL